MNPYLAKRIGWRSLRIIELKDIDKLTFTEIGKKFHISQQRASQLYRSAKELFTLDRTDPLEAELPVKIGSVCRRHGLETKEQVVAAIRSGRLHPDKIRQYGHKSHRFLCQWAGVELPEPPTCRDAFDRWSAENDSHDPWKIWLAGAKWARRFANIRITET